MSLSPFDVELDPAPTPDHPAGSHARQSRQGRPRRHRLLRIARNVGVPLLLAGLVTAGSPGWGLYTIRSGDTLSDIAARYGTTVARLVEVNRLPGNGSLIFAGRTLQVPGGGTSGGARSHLVVRGDTLSGIASRYGVSQEAVARANNLPSSDIVLLGATLRIPGAGSGGGGGGGGGASTSSGGNTFAGRTYASSIVSAADRNRSVLARRGVPSRDGMRSIIAARAAANGVDPALALAVSYQESGWNQRAVSVANAVGAMQVIPTTTDWISAVVGRRLNPLDPHDNATTGVVLLKILKQSAASERQAVAGYYQGLRSVRERGMYPDTRRYVDNVLALKARFN